MQIEKVCGYRTQNVTLKGLQKSIVRTRTTKYIQVHVISLGESLYINHTADMVMIHTKKLCIKDNPIAIISNSFVRHSLNNELFSFFICNKNNFICIISNNKGKGKLINYVIDFRKNWYSLNNVAAYYFKQLCKP